jgi:precorrin-6B methylase 2
MLISNAPDYSEAAIDAMLSIAGAEKSDKFCDVGAGVAHLTLMLAARGLDTVAVERMMPCVSNGIKRTEKFTNVRGTRVLASRQGRSIKSSTWRPSAVRLTSVIVSRH